MDMRFGPDMYQSFVRYQTRLIKALDSMVEPYEFTVIDAGPADLARFSASLQQQISRLQLGGRVRPRGPPAKQVEA